MKRLLFPILLVLLSLLSLAPFTFGGKAIYFGNIADLYVPFRAYAAAVLSEGQMPLWTPFLYSGYPFLADPQSSVFYPTTLLFMILNPVRAIVWETALSLSVAALGMYLLLRILRFSTVASFLGALLFSGSGFFTAHIQHTPLLSAAVWLPLLLSCSLLAWERRNLPTHQSGARCGVPPKHLTVPRAPARGAPLFALLGGMILSLTFFAGHPQYAFYFSLLVVVECLVRVASGFRKGERGTCVRAVSIALTILLTAAGLAAVQILPTAEFALLSERQEGLGLKEIGLFGWTFSHFLRLLSPYAFLPAEEADVWWRTDIGETTGYVGILALLLAAVGIWKGGRRGRLWGLSFLLVGTLLALSPTLPFTDVLVRIIPGFGFFRVPGRFILFQTFGFAVLSASGVEVFLGGEAPPPEAKSLPAHAPQPRGLASSLLRLSLAPRVLFLIVCALVFLDLTVFRLSFIPPVTPPPAIFGQFPLPSSRITGVSRLLTQKVASNFALLQGVENANGYTPLTVRRYTELLGPILGGNIPDSAMLRFLNIDMALRPEEFPRYGSEEIRSSFAARNPNVLPRASVVHRYVLEGELQQPPGEYLHSRAFDPRREVLLDGDPFPLPEALREFDRPSSAVLKAHTPMGVVVEADLGKTGLLVLSEVFYPGWKATVRPRGLKAAASSDATAEPRTEGNVTSSPASLPSGAWVDGEEKPILRANGAFRAVALPAGRHTVEFRYDPLSFRVGRMISVVTLIVVGGVFLYALRRR